MTGKELLTPITTVSSRTVYSNRWITVTEDTVKRHDGTPGIFGVVNMRDGATVLAIDGNGSCYVVAEYKYAYGRVSIELISGGIEEGESPLNAAKRELEEEVGVLADKWTDLGVLHPFTSLIASANHMFLAEGLHAGVQSLDPGEALSYHLVPFEQLRAEAIAGRVVHGASCVAVLRAALLRGGHR